jgi:hypothetical protein
MTSVQEAHAYVIELFEQHGEGAWKIRWNRMAGTAGITNYRTKTVTLSARAIEKWDWPLVVQLGLHELAHVKVGQGHGHDEIWEAMIVSLGGEPAENCPRFSSGLARYLGKAGESENILYVLMILAASWITVPPIGLALTIGFFGGALVAGLRNARPVLPSAERMAIEKDVLLK